MVPIHPKVWAVARCAEPWQDKITVQSYFRRASQEAGHADLHFHDLRHSSASAMTNSGVDLYTVGAVLGHKDAKSTKRYSHLATASLAAALGTIGKAVSIVKCNT
ncbi:tyrosine-type recombinase/integrase [Acidovorax sp. Leaf160]|uniref:tyrosine-type recombinase/integrase n=1 Tax=Acidovorax sp. Leaf160 TaxID=1736280 RepID=UPI000A9C40B1|nr:tyrosine-type recombinase/integrase [Acidovorax sp. Leaf160]